MSEKPVGAMKNGQSRETVNTGHIRHGQSSETVNTGHIRHGQSSIACGTYALYFSLIVILTTIQTLLLCMDHNLSYSSLFLLDMEYTLYIHKKEEIIGILFFTLQLHI
jgi:hypothetical protein